MVKGQRYLMDMKVGPFGYSNHFLAIARKTSERSWSSWRGESQTFDIKYDYHGEELTLNLGNVVGGTYKLQLVYKPFGGDVVTETTDAILWNDDPKSYIWYFYPSVTLKSYRNGAFPQVDGTILFVIANASGKSPQNIIICII